MCTYQTMRNSLMSTFDLHTDVCDMFFFSFFHFPCSDINFLFFDKNPTGLFFGKYVAFQSDDLFVEPKNFFSSFWRALFYVLLEIWFIYRQ